jgi:mono/diheme cytochrome c family protein
MRNRGAYSGLLLGGIGSIAGGSTARHNIALNGGIPASYAHKRNPLPPTPENARRGAAVYEANCASCHGETGLADAPQSRKLTPPPAQLGWLNKVPASRWDGFMYWTVAEGGAPFKTAMPAYKTKLTDQEIWSVIGYIQARLPKPKTASR